MKRKWLIPVLIAIVIGVLSYGLMRWATCSRCKPLPDHMEDVLFLTQELGLTKAQARDIQQLQLSLGAKLKDCCERHCAARARLGKAFINETNNAAPARALVADMCRAYEESELATLAHIQRVRDLLNPKQKRRFDELIGKCLCRSCSMCGGRAEAAPKLHSGD